LIGIPIRLSSIKLIVSCLTPTLAIFQLYRGVLPNWCFSFLSKTTIETRGLNVSKGYFPCTELFSFQPISMNFVLFVPLWKIPTYCDLRQGQWFYPGTLISSTNKTDHHAITEILLKVALNTTTITLTLNLLSDGLDVSD
jgi:hypothetical protein